MTRNSSSSDNECVTTSGNAVTICCSGESSALFLNSKSPMARDKARFPLTRPKSTKPPAADIRAFSATSKSEVGQQLRTQGLAHPHFVVCGQTTMVLPGLSHRGQNVNRRHWPEFQSANQDISRCGRILIYHVNLVMRYKANGRCAPRSLVFEFGIYIRSQMPIAIMSKPS